MADPQTTPALAPLEPLQVSPPPVTAGYGNPLAGIAAEFFKLHAADNRRQANRELDRREQLAQQFDQFSTNPAYVNHPTLQRDAHMHAAAIRQIPYNRNLPSQYKPNPDGHVPAYVDLFHRAATADTRRNGEPSKPTEPAQPPPPANPFAAAPPAPNAGPFGPTDFAPDAISTGPPAPVAEPMPGGVHTAPGRVSPAPAIGNAPPQLTAAPATPATPEEIYPMTPPEMAAFQNSIPVHGALAEALGVPDGSTIDMRELQRGSSLVKGSADRKARLAIHGLDEDANPLPADQLSPEQQYKRAAADMAEAHTKLFAARAISDPMKAKAEIAHWQAMEGIARSNLGLATERLGLGKERLDLERSLSGGSGAPTPVPNAGGSGGPSDMLSDPEVKTTVSGRQYMDLSRYSIKTRAAVARRYESMGVTPLDASDLKTIKDIDNARTNYDSMINDIEDKLPKDASGRVLGGLGNKLSQFFQTDAELAAFGAWRTTAIRGLRAAAGSGGLRLNQTEIRLAVDNDIPKITDTVAVARQKAANMRAQFDNTETSIIVPRRAGKRGSSGRDDYSGAAITQPPPALGAAPGARMQKTQTNRTTGQTRTVYSDDGGATWHP